MPAAMEPGAFVDDVLWVTKWALNCWHTTSYFFVLGREFERPQYVISSVTYTGINSSPPARLDAILNRWKGHIHLVHSTGVAKSNGSGGVTRLVASSP